jgi:excisionase family DNA binding protein
MRLAVPANGQKKNRRFMTPKEAADELSVSCFTIWRWVREKKANCFPVKRVGNKMLIPRQKFEDWCNADDNR